MPPSRPNPRRYYNRLTRDCVPFLAAYTGHTPAAGGASGGAGLSGDSEGPHQPPGGECNLKGSYRMLVVAPWDVHAARVPTPTPTPTSTPTGDAARAHVDPTGGNNGMAATAASTDAGADAGASAGPVASVPVGDLVVKFCLPASSFATMCIRSLLRARAKA